MKPDNFRNKSLFAAFKNSFNGVYTLIVRERNLRIHLLFAIMVLIAGLYLHLNRSEWLWVTIAVAIAVTAEILNTIIETVVDLIVEKQFNQLAGLAKDVAAAGVLFAVGVELIILAIIFQPHIWQVFGIHQLFG